MQRLSLLLLTMILGGALGLCSCSSAPAKTKTSSPMTTATLITSHPEQGGGWTLINYNSPGDKKIHLSNLQHKIQSLDWEPGKDIEKSVGDPPCASYKYDKKTDTETFQLYEMRTNRSEIRLYNEYEFGARQFEGYVTFYEPADDESLFQIWGSDQGATELMLRCYAANNGSLGVQLKHGGGTPKFLHDLYGKETKVNVIHLQEDMGNKIIVFLNDQKVVEFPDNMKAINHNNQNYHKYGVYGTVRPGHESPKVIWRKVRHYVAGNTPPAR